MFQEKPYGRESMKQIAYERCLCKLKAEALTPLSLCEIPAYQKHVRFLDSRILPVSRTQLTRKVIPEIFAEQKQNLIDELQKITCAALQFDLWMTKKTKETF